MLTGIKSNKNLLSLLARMQNDTNEFTYKTETDSQTEKINLWLPKGKGAGDK